MSELSSETREKAITEFDIKSDVFGEVATDIGFKVYLFDNPDYPDKGKFDLEVPF